jgi:hypothetical protein
MPACICAPSLVLLAYEFDIAHPGRSTSSDGCCASPQHTAQNPTSDHETGDARDYTKDVRVGMLSREWAEEIKDDPRVKYIIRDGQIYNADIAGYWRTYTGSNDHSRHGHVSIHPWSRDDLRPWLTDPTGDLDIMDKDTKAYLDAQFNGITQRQRRARETQLAHGKVLKRLVAGGKATREEIEELDRDFDRLARELSEEGDG